MARGALEGVRVIELGPLIALPLTCRILAALGAEVIKVESNRVPDIMNYLPAWGIGSGRPEYDALKRKMTLDVSHPEAAPIMHKLLAESDVFVTNFRRHILKRWGIDFPEIRATNPEIIIMWQTGVGGEGPYAGYKFFGYPSQHTCGISLMTGYPEDEITAAETSYSDYHTALFQPMAVIAALLKRKRTGKPSTIETSIWKAGVVTVGPAFLDFQANGRFPRRLGNRDPYACPHNVYPCKGEDRWCAISVFTEKEWQAFCGVLGDPPWTKDARFGTLLDRKRNEDELDELIGRWSVNYEAQEVMEKMQKAGVPAGVVAKGQDLYESPQLRARDFYQETEYYLPDFSKPGIEWQTAPQPTLVSRVPIYLSETPTEVGRYGRVGEDNEYVYREVIGISAEEMKRLVEIGVIR